MQNTRLNNLINFGISRLRIWLFNPWRRISIWVIGLLLGFFLGSAVSTIAGQTAQLDVISAGILLAIVEIINRLVYGKTPVVTDNDRGLSTIARPNDTSADNNSTSFGIRVLNATKIGFVYSMFVEALKLGS